jgi:putative phosphoribosyl transferase
MMYAGYTDRRHAGRVLADYVRDRVELADAVVLALPRGGVPVGYELARALGLPLDVFVVRKLGLPQQPEVAMGAVASGGFRVLDTALIQRAQVSEAELAQVERTEWKTLRAREEQYRRGMPAISVEHRTAVLVDDGLATGYTMRAAIQALRNKSGVRLVVAVPVGAADTCEEIAREVHSLICPFRPEPFRAVGCWYEDFSPTSDEEVCFLLSRSTLPAASQEPTQVPPAPRRSLNPY